MVRLFRRKIYQVSDIELPFDLPVIDVPSLDDLKAFRKDLFESETEVILINNKGGIAYRYLKDPSPKLVKAEALNYEVNAFPLSVKLSQDALFEFAKAEDLTVLETAECFYVPSNNGLFYHNKEAKK